ncbi:hypothetical protein GGR51DRAFT_535965 [Nemania sp. FL0031]|nr:hypothetical protein GGR51DRAFT_535965 [Nemania sp. FL0031]
MANPPPSHHGGPLIPPAPLLIPNQTPAQTLNLLPIHHLFPTLPGWPQPDDEERGLIAICVACGGACNRITSSPVDDEEEPSWLQPILIRGKPRFLEWQKENREREKERSSGSARRLCPLAKRLLPKEPNDEELIELIEPTEYLGGSRMKVGSRVLSMNTRDSLMRLPIHEACYEICQYFCKVKALYEPDPRDPSGGPPRSMAHLYEIWCKRAIAACPSGPLRRPILEPYMYAATRQSLPRRPAFTRSIGSVTLARGTPDVYPLSIPNLTTIIVENLQTMDGKEDHPHGVLAETYDRYCKLPKELRDMIADAVDPLEEEKGPPLTPTRFLPCVWWKENLFNGKLIPWLWDLFEQELEDYRIITFYTTNTISDPYENKESGSYIFDENMWDWELLCRQLAQPNVMEPGGMFGTQSQGLANRYRIWKVLDRARLGHVRFS